MRLGIYGGTFSPPHIGHTEAAAAFVKQMKLDRLLVIPTFTPPHKDFSEEAGAERRLEMCRLAFSSIPMAEVSDLEIKRGGKSYTYITLEELSEGGNELFFLCGTDMLLTFDLWKRYEYIFSLATICYARRESDKQNDEKIKEKIRQYEKLGAKIVKIEHSVTEVSSSQLRLDIKRGGRVPYLHKAVQNYIQEKGLYR
ncbi:MAG: nicotinate (nicotinamide) nucleotide adenylyltransferase [Clostridia bacterium]|nr:nicotinate (nicotinamide) nucleotide adenylyltransferase [Clostridia bacterium]